MHIFSGVHRSGVNCLHVSEMEDCSCSTPDISYCIISGGDDQAGQCFSFTLGSLQGCSTNTTSLNSPDNDALKILCQHRVPSAHSSAVKGIWTECGLSLLALIKELDVGRWIWQIHGVFPCHHQRA